ncbi:urease accessory protein UreE [Enterococcus ureasiticus]|uniref:Urease accessory protein UreE n=1 Tax=Enterococcus ureasiticus TaxID=903984 RepID=A0A1E5GII6_9ENTE|nr:urease accessory protein UreE [Enterococcus ureasiticus]OEG12060.1 urease accessory protein UreE [Enterococcus ureasiticus]
MILTTIDSNIDEIDDITKYHVETVVLSSDDLNKRILRVTTDHSNDYGIRLTSESEALRNGSIFFIDDHNVLVIAVRSEEMIIIKPSTMDEMGEIAHLLGNTHKPVVVEDGKIVLEVDPTVVDLLIKKNISYEIKKIKLRKALKHVDLSHEH